MSEDALWVLLMWLSAMALGFAIVFVAWLLWQAFVWTDTFIRWQRRREIRRLDREEALRRQWDAQKGQSRYD